MNDDQITPMAALLLLCERIDFDFREDTPDTTLDIAQRLAERADDYIALLKPFSAATEGKA